MRTTLFILISVSFTLELACSGSSVPTAADTTGPRGIWASDQVSLAITDSDATVQILASGGCVGSYGKIMHPIPAGRFSLAGTYTQLIGAYPGHLDYAAQYAGLVDGNHLTLTITVATLPQPFGPFQL